MNVEPVDTRADYIFLCLTGTVLNSVMYSSQNQKYLSYFKGFLLCTLWGKAKRILFQMFSKVLAVLLLNSFVLL